MKTRSLISPLERKRRVYAQGFSLVEVTIAIAVVVISLLPILAMLPAGLNNYKNSVYRTKAAHLLSEISTCIQLATPPNPNGTPPTSIYTALAPFNSGSNVISFTTGGTAKLGPVYFDENGNPVTGNATPQLVAWIYVNGPGTNFTPGSAYIYVAWPAPRGATYTWSSSNTISYPTAQGHEEITIPINPTTP